MKIGIVGAGVSGLPGIKYAVEDGHEVVCFERMSKLGGCWSGDGRVGEDELGNHISSGMYKGLRTNLPKEIMVYAGLQHDPLPESYVGQAEVLKYLQSYAKKHELAKYIFFGHEVVEIRPITNDPNTRWKVVVKNRAKPEDALVEHEFDALMLASGHFVYNYVAKIKDAELFKGTVLHSNDFRDPEEYSNKRVVVIGAGPSGSDIAKKISHYSKVCFQSIKAPPSFVPIYEKCVTKVEIERFDANGAHFKDGSYEPVDVVIYCTGYEYRLPCKMPDCGLKVENNWFKHLYRHCVNIERPSMFIIGLPYGASLLPLVDLQVRYVLAHLARKFTLPSRDAMLETINQEHQFRKSKGIPDRAFHSFPDTGRELSGTMAKEAGIKPTPDFVFNIMKSLRERWTDQDIFEVLDDSKFIRKSPQTA